MRLYSGSSQQFIEDTYQNRISEKLKVSYFEQFGCNPAPSELNSWRNSLRATSMVFQHARLTDHGVLIEYQLPQSSMRLDCMICGKDDSGKDKAVILELKQWDKCESAEGENEVLTYVGGSQREILHPSVQVGRYRQYLEDTHTAFHEGPNPIQLNACAYLHNYPYDSQDVIFSSRFREAILQNPIFTMDDVPRLETFLIDWVGAGQGLEVLRRVEESKYRPSKKLMDHVGNVIKGKSEYILLDEQLVVYDKVFAIAKRGFQDKKKTVLIVKGGPGTGKSVIAINLMADLLLRGFNAQYATGSRAFTGTLKKILGSRANPQLRFFNSYGQAEYNEIDVLVADEAHRIRETSVNRFTPKVKQTGMAQIEELIRAAKVAVFFIDDHQIVRPKEIGSVRYIREHAEKSGCNLFEYELQAQFRCAGSDAFVNWVNNTLGIERTANALWGREEEFDFRIFETPEALEKAIFEKAAQGFTARMTAGFCWPWSNPKPDGTLEEDVVIGSYRRPWNAKSDAGKLAKGIPKEITWAYEPGGLNQIGCIYTAQGFEFDYVGVIFGKDLVYDPNGQKWVGVKEESYDTEVKRSGSMFTDLVKNTYRVLLTRGMKGCYVHFMDRDTELFFRSRMEKPHF